MNELRREIYEDIVNRLAYMVKRIGDSDEPEVCQRVLGVSFNQANDILKKIIIALPEVLITTTDHKQLNATKNLLIKEFILFQCQEDLASEQYPELLSNFILYTAQDLLKQQEKVGVGNEH